MNITIWHYWHALKYVFDTRAYFENSQLFRLYEKPVITLLWFGWPVLHIVLVIATVYFFFKTRSAATDYDRHRGNDPQYPGSGWLLFACLAIVPYVFTGTLGGKRFENFVQLQRAAGSIIPVQMPPIPPPYIPNVRILTGEELIPDRRDMRYWVQASRAAPLLALREEAAPLLGSLDFLIVFSWAPIVFWICVLRYWPYFLFALAYHKAIAQPHLPTNIVDRALSGGAIDQHALAAALTPSLAPVTPNSVADKVERERLVKLASRLQADTDALNTKLVQEAEIARLVVSHARKREELADMEKKLRDMGVRRDG